MCMQPAVSADSCHSMWHQNLVQKPWIHSHGMALSIPRPQPNWISLESCQEEAWEYEESPSGVHELWDRFQEEWEKIEPSVCQNLIESMPRRIEAVIRVKGGYTKYQQLSFSFPKNQLQKTISMTYKLNIFTKNRNIAYLIWGSVDGILMYLPYFLGDFWLCLYHAISS